MQAGSGRSGLTLPKRVSRPPPGAERLAQLSLRPAPPAGRCLMAPHRNLGWHGPHRDYAPLRTVLLQMPAPIKPPVRISSGARQAGPGHGKGLSGDDLQAGKPAMVSDDNHRGHGNANNEGRHGIAASCPTDSLQGRGGIIIRPRRRTTSPAQKPHGGGDHIEPRGHLALVRDVDLRQQHEPAEPKAADELDRGWRRRHHESAGESWRRRGPVVPRRR